MAEVPTVAEIERVRGQLLELAKCYSLLYEMWDVRPVMDILMGDSYRAKRMKEVEESFRNVLALMQRIDEVELVSNDLMALAREWPDVLNTLEHYSFAYVEVETGVKHYMQEFFADLRTVATALGLNPIEIEEEVDRRLGPGRPVWSGSITSAEQFIENAHKFCAPYFEKGERPTQEALGRGLFPRQNIDDGPEYYSRSVRRYRTKCSSEGYPFHDYASFLEYLKRR